MAMTVNSATVRRKSDLGALSSLGCDMEVAHCLRSIGSQFGRVLHVHPLPALLKSGRKAASFLVVFDSDGSAVRASREMDCPLFGFTTVIVSIPRDNEELKIPSPPQLSPAIQFNATHRGMI
jgi:hypothetical protein